MIEVSNLTKDYGATRALNGISVNINSGEITGILGPNGAGKTTLMKTITCYMYPTKGNIKVENFNIFDNSMEIRNKIGYLPEHAPIYTDTTVYDYLKFVSEIRKIPKNQIHNKIKEVAKTCGLTDVAYKNIDSLSKGYRQRVGLAQALIHDPDILILDEPTTGLDPNQIIEIRNLIKKLGESKTIIFSTHILQEVQALCDRVIIINKGNIVADGDLNSLQSSISGREEIFLIVKSNNDITDLLNTITSIKKIEKIEEKEDFKSYKLENDKNFDIREKIFDLCVKNNIKMLELRREKISLEDLFKELTKEK